MIMKQRRLVRELYQACLEHDAERQQELLKMEFKKIVKRRSQHRAFTGRWTVVR